MGAWDVPAPPPLPILPVPTSVTGSTGVFLFDTLCMWTMAACVPTLMLYYRKRRYGDLVIFGVGFALALVYHAFQLDPDGLTKSQFLGVGGATWRTLDVLWAQWLLARTFGHAIGASHLATQGAANAGFPALLLRATVLGGQLDMGKCVSALLMACGGVFALKTLLEGVKTLPAYDPDRGRRILGLFGLAFAFFPLPDRFPAWYWLFHSLWHVFVGAAVYELYMALEGEAVDYSSFWSWAANHVQWGTLLFDAALAHVTLSASCSPSCLGPVADLRPAPSPPSDAACTTTADDVFSAAGGRRSADRLRSQQCPAADAHPNNAHRHPEFSAGPPAPTRPPDAGPLRGRTLLSHGEPCGPHGTPVRTRSGRGPLAAWGDPCDPPCGGAEPDAGTRWGGGGPAWRAWLPAQVTLTCVNLSWPALPQSWPALPQGWRTVGRGRSRAVRWGRQQAGPRDAGSGKVEVGGKLAGSWREGGSAKLEAGGKRAGSWQEAVQERPACAGSGSRRLTWDRQWPLKGVDAAKALSWVQNQQAAFCPQVKVGRVWGWTWQRCGLA